jgi:hypothetical protein
MPSRAEALTNFVYVNPTEMFSVYLKIHNYVYMCAPHCGVNRGYIALNAVQRRNGQSYVGDVIEVQGYDASGYTRYIDLSVEPVKGDEDLMVNPQNITDMFQSHFSGHLFRKNQKITMMCADQMLLFTVLDVGRGRMSNTTDIDLQVIPILT